MYTCGIIKESLNDISMLSKISVFLFKTRLQKLPDEEPDIWHVNEYHIIESDLISLLPKMIENIKEGWYIHAFNIEANKLYVVLKGKYFVLPTKKDNSWDEMIMYADSVGCEERWTKNIPLRV
jgi:hypothetical protein